MRRVGVGCDNETKGEACAALNIERDAGKTLLAMILFLVVARSFRDQLS
jgi:hypothetical protein